ncbi:hypothetical protein NDU88_005166, partial [Pleurodeles waltl]
VTVKDSTNNWTQGKAQHGRKHKTECSEPVTIRESPANLEQTGQEKDEQPCFERLTAGREL